MAGDVKHPNTTSIPGPVQPTRAPQSPAPAGVDIIGFSPASGTPEARRFCDVGAAIQRQTPGRIVASLATTTHRISPAFGFYEHGRARHFVASRNGVDIGRCSAIINDQAQQADAELVGYIGQWECIDDASTARALLDAAIAWLAGEGCHQVVGPIDFSTWFGYRFSLGPWDGETLAFEPGTPPHYVTQWLSYGFHLRRTYVTTVREDIASGLFTGDAKLASSIAAGYTFCHMRMRDFDALLRSMYAQSKAAFANAPDAAPITWDDFRDMYAGLRTLLDPRLVWFVRAPDGSVAGMALALPNHARALRALGGRSTLRARIAALLRMHQATDVLFKTIFIHPDHQGQGLSVALAQRVWTSAHNLGYRKVYHHLMDESNMSLDNSERSGTVPARRYGLFELQLRDANVT